MLSLSRRLRQAIGLEHGDNVAAEVAGDSLVLRVPKPRVVDTDPNFVEELLREEARFEEHRYRRMFQNQENSA